MIHKKQWTALVIGLMMLLLAACIPQGGGPLPGTGGTPATSAPSNPAPATAVPPTAVQTQPPGASDPLANTQWTLVSIGQAGTETPVPQGASPTIQFDESQRASGFSGCNTFGGGYQVQDGRLIFDQLVSTLIACQDQKVMDLEQRYLKAIQSAGEFTLSGDQLVIQYDNDQGALTFTRSLAATQAPTQGAPDPLANTQWSLESFGLNSAVNPVVAGSTLTLQFDSSGQASGSGGCNTFGGAYQVQGNTLSLNNLVSTERACLEQALNQQEQSYLQALQGASTFEIDGGNLVIHYNNAQGVLNFIKANGAGTGTPEASILCSPDAQATDPNWKLCRSEQFGFEVQYPQAGDLIDQTGTTARINLPFTAGTNLTEKYMDISAAENSATCTSPLTAGHEPGSIPTGPVQMNGITFTKETGQDGAAGSTYNWVAYSTSQGNVCVSLSFVLRSHQPELEPTPPPVFNMDEESQVFEEVVNTFRWLNASVTPTAALATATPVPATATPTRAPATAAPTAVPATEEPTSPAAARIRFRAGATSATINGRLDASGSNLYVLSAAAGQNMTINLSFTRGRAILAVWGADGDVLLSDHAEAATFNDVLPKTQDYFILVRGRPNGITRYSMQVTIPPLSGTAVPATPSPVRISFRAGATSATVDGSLLASGSDEYVLSASRGQTLSIDMTFTKGRAILAVWGADGTVLLSDHAEASSFQADLPRTQDYYILVKGRPNGATDYTMKVTIPPLR